jgi:hypothetical protein
MSASSHAVKLILTGTNNLRMRAFAHRLNDGEEGIIALARTLGISAMPALKIKCAELGEVAALVKRNAPHARVLACFDETDVQRIVPTVLGWMELALGAEHRAIALPAQAAEEMKGRFPALASSVSAYRGELDFPLVSRLAFGLVHRGAQPESATSAGAEGAPPAEQTESGEDMSALDSFLSGLLKADAVVASTIINMRCGSVIERHKEAKPDYPLSDGLNSLLYGSSRLGFNQMQEAILSYARHDFVFCTVPVKPHLVCGMVVDKNRGNSAMEKIRLKRALSEFAAESAR